MNDRPPVTVLAVDDERPALEELRFLLLRQPGIGAVDTADDATNALRLLHDHAYDAVFLDVRMPGLDGMEVARLLRRFADPPAVVFVTAFDDYAIEAFEVNASDYLLKPVSAQRLAATMAKLRPERLTDDAGAGSSEELAAVPIETGTSTHWVERSTVCWVEANGDYVRLHTTDGTAHLVRLALSLLQDRWSSAGFVRIHRSYLVNLRFVTELRTEPSGGHVVRVAGRDLPVSRRSGHELKERLTHVARQAPSPLR